MAAANIHLVGNVDAMEWVEAWMQTIEEHPTIPQDEGTMLGWFSNAIMSGYDKGREHTLQRVEDSIEKSTRRLLNEIELEHYRRQMKSGRRRYRKLARILRGLLGLPRRPAGRYNGVAGAAPVHKVKPVQQLRKQP